jgi:hypothetical protein
MTKRVGAHVLWLTLAVGCADVATGFSGADIGAENPSGVATGEVRLADPGCGPAVSRIGRTLRVVPTGGDDTAGLQCALDAATAAGVPMTVELAPGRFVTGPLLAVGFRGRLRGAGEHATLVTNPSWPMAVFAGDWSLAPPSPSNIWPSLVTFLGGAFAVSDLSLSVTGDQPTTGSDFGYGTVYSMVMGIAVVGDHAEAAFERVTEDPVFGYNVGNGIYFEGLVTWPDPPPISGSLSVRGCTIRGVASGTPLYNVRHGRVEIVGNRLTGGSYGGDIADLEDVDLIIAGNDIDASQSGLLIYEFCLSPAAVCGLPGSRLLVAGNRIAAPDGVMVIGQFDARTRCAILGNAIGYDAAGGGHAVVLGPETHECLVVEHGDVLDQGAGNVVIDPWGHRRQ